MTQDTVATTEVDLAECVGKMVTLEYLEKGQPLQMDGRIEKVAPVAIIIRERGVRGPASLKLIQVSDIRSLEILPEMPKGLRAKRLNPVEPEAVRRHLLDNHYCSLAFVNSLTDEAAVEWHDKQDHTGMGHDHTRGQELDDLVVDSSNEDDDEN